MDENEIERGIVKKSRKNEKKFRILKKNWVKENERKRQKMKESDRK